MVESTASMFPENDPVYMSDWYKLTLPEYAPSTFNDRPSDTLVWPPHTLLTVISPPGEARETPQPLRATL